MEHRFYLGIDLDDQYAVISSYELNKKEPETFSAIAGSEIYQIPALITKKKGIGQWFVGEEAVRLAIAQGEEANGRLLSRAVSANWPRKAKFTAPSGTISGRSPMARGIKKASI